jgi:hypothetical protein
MRIFSFGGFVAVHFLYIGLLSPDPSFGFSLRKCHTSLPTARSSRRPRTAQECPCSLIIWTYGSTISGPPCRPCRFVAHSTPRCVLNLKAGVIAIIPITFHPDHKILVDRGELLTQDTRLRNTLSIQSKSNPSGRNSGFSAASNLNS